MMALRAGSYLLIALLICGSITVDGQTNGDQRRLVCHYSALAQERPTNGSYRLESFPGDLCTHVVYDYAGVDEDTYELMPLQRNIDVVENGFGRIGDLKSKFTHLKTAIAVGGWAHGGDKFNKMVAFRWRRQKFVESVKSFLDQYGFDGLELVWLYPGDSTRGGNNRDKDNFVYLVQDLKKAFKAKGKGWELMIRVPADTTKLRAGYEIDVLCKTADFVSLIGYDMRGYWDNFADVHSPLTNRPHDQGVYRGINVRTGVETWLASGCRPSNTILGVPLFGRSYTLTNAQQNTLGSPTTGAGPAGRYTREPGYLGYFEICQKLKTAGWQESWDDVAKCPYAFQGKEWIGYENEQSLEEKIKYVKQKQLAGIYAFSVDLDDFQGACGGVTYPLLRKLYQFIEETKEDSDFDTFVARPWDKK